MTGEKWTGYLLRDYARRYLGVRRLPGGLGIKLRWFVGIPREQTHRLIHLLHQYVDGARRLP
jgi:hypothetical protein